VDKIHNKAGEWKLDAKNSEEYIMPSPFSWKTQKKLDCCIGSGYELS